MTRKFPNTYIVIKNIFPDAYKLPEDEIYTMSDILRNQGDTYDEAESLLKKHINQKQSQWKQEYLKTDNDSKNQNLEAQPSPYAVHMNLIGFTDNKLQKNYPDFNLNFPNRIEKPASKSALVNDCLDSPRFQQFINNTEQREKIGYVTKDIEQPTMTGVNQTSYVQLRKKYPEMKTAYPQKLKDLNQDQWRNIYCQEYYKRPHGELINHDHIRDMVLDQSVLRGQENTAKCLQSILNNFGYAVDVDGVLGSQTIKALNSIENPDEFVEYAKPRVFKCFPDDPRFNKGWYDRTQKY